MVVFIALRIIPQFEKIFKDFALPLPDITRWVFAGGHSTTVLISSLGAAWLLTAGIGGYLVLRYAGSIRWDLPGVGWLMRRRHAAIVLDGLSLAAERQKPFADAVMQMAIAYPKRKVANRLWKAYDLMEAGENDLEALCRVAVLGQSDVALLKTALSATATSPGRRGSWPIATAAA